MKANIQREINGAPTNKEYQEWKKYLWNQNKCNKIGLQFETFWLEDLYGHI